MSKAEHKAVTYEEALAELEQIVEQIESGEAGLEKSLVDYERGVQIIKHCREILNRVETRLAELSPDEEGRLRETGTESPGEGQR
ncbi:MAG: exodeoxyribonuclease VII small subunit [Phycisphaeraceae bacterium]|nr:exodeoxyribonuclease VII small subunit [Phycisphaeraceae bacterium]